MIVTTLVIFGYFTVATTSAETLWLIPKSMIDVKTRFQSSIQLSYSQRRLSTVQYLAGECMIQELTGSEVFYSTIWRSPIAKTILCYGPWTHHWNISHTGNTSAFMNTVRSEKWMRYLQISDEFVKGELVRTELRATIFSIISKTCPMFVQWSNAWPMNLDKHDSIHTFSTTEYLAEMMCSCHWMHDQCLCARMALFTHLQPLNTWQKWCARVTGCMISVCGQGWLYSHIFNHWIPGRNDVLLSLDAWSVYVDKDSFIHTSSTTEYLAQMICSCHSTHDRCMWTRMVLFSYLPLLNA